MEHSTAASSSDLNGNYHMYKDHLHPSVLCIRTSEGNPKNMPLFHSNLHNASMCASQDGRSATQVCAGCTPIEPFQGDGCDTLVSSSGNIDVSSSLHEPNSGLHESSIDETMRAHIQPAPPAHSSPEALLDVISTAQKKLQHLQALAELLVQVGGQAQQQQSLVAGMKYVMSQLYAATAGFCGQPAPVSASASQLRRASIAQLSQALDLTFDDFSTHEMNMFTSSCLGSILGAAPNEGFFPLSNTLPCSEMTQSAMELVRVRSVHAVQMGPDLTRSAMGHVHGGPGGSKPSGTKDPQLKKQRFNSSGPNPIKHNNTSSTPVENRVSNESPHVGVETCESGHGMCGNRSQEMFGLEDHDYASIFRDDDDEDVEGENLPPGSYELVEMAAAEILAEHTHFCEICGKGFKRDANLRMHMRGHGDEYKTPAALARPDKCLHSPSKLRRYSCPYVGCKRNKKHRKFQPLKTTLCVKNHYRRSHCPKLLICSKCKTKKFSVVADLKTHEKHCGQDKWLCSCGTTFSRKDKLVGHVSLFVGHTPAVPIHEMECLNEQAREEEGLEGHSTSKPSYLTAVDSFSMSSENGQTLMNTLMTENDNGMRMTDTTIMGKEVLMSENYGQQKCPATRVHPGEKSSLTDNFERGAMEVMQHCG